MLPAVAALLFLVLCPLPRMHVYGSAVAEQVQHQVQIQSQVMGMYPQYTRASACLPASFGSDERLGDGI